MAATPLDWMKKKTPADLSQYLQRRGLEKSIAERLEEEEINGVHFLDVDAGLLRECGFKAGQILQILKHVPKNNQAEAMEKDATESGKDDADDDSWTHDTDEDQNTNALSASSDEDSEKENTDRTNEFSKLSKYMDLRGKSVYENRRDLKLLLRWEESHSKGHAHAGVLKPSFVSDWEQAEERRRKKSQAQSQSRVSTVSSGRNSVQLRELTNVSGSTPTAQSGPMLNVTASTSSAHAVPSGSGILRRLKHNALPTYDVRSILESFKKDVEEDEMGGEDHEDVVQIIDSLMDGNLLSNKDRKKLFRLLTNHLYFELVSDPTSVTTKMKEGLAKSFVNDFPQYKSDLLAKPWGAIYDRDTNTGFFANSARRVQKKHRVRRRKSKKLSVESDQVEEDLSPEALSVMNVTMPGRAEKSEILDGMARSFQIRQKYRKDQRTIHDFLSDFCHFAHYEGEVIREEFKRMYPEAEDMAKNLLQKLPNILNLTPAKPITLGCEDDVLKAVVMISHHVSHDITRRGQRSTVVPRLRDFFIVVKPTDDIQTVIDQRAEENGGPVQPYMIVVKALLSNKVIKHFLILDSRWVELPGVSTVKALQHLMQCYFVFNVAYPSGWRSTFHALATLFYKVFEKRERGQRQDQITPSEDQFWLMIK